MTASYVSDVTMLIANILGNNDAACVSCGDMDGNGILNVADVTALITYVLNSGPANIQAPMCLVSFP